MSIDAQMSDNFFNRVLSDLAAGHNGVMISIGSKLGLYNALAGAGPLNSREVAKRANCNARYVQEWLNSQVAGGYVNYHPSSEAYELSDEQAAVLADKDSPTYMPPAWEITASMWFDEARSLEAIRNGDGVPWGEHHERLYCGVSAFFRNAYRASLVQSWLPALDGMEDRLKQGIRVADVGCGYGHSTILMAEAFPSSRFFGFDVHAASISEAEGNARKADVTERVIFETAGAQEYRGENFDLICFFDCLHDMGDPVGAARYAADRLADGGTLMLIEPFANHRVEDNIGPVGRLYYAASTTLCCAHSLSEDVGLALGAQAGEQRLAEVLRKAGFGTIRVALETPFNMILEARR